MWHFSYTNPAILTATIILVMTKQHVFFSEVKLRYQLLTQNNTTVFYNFCDFWWPENDQNWSKHVALE
jgi:hypothetical protein